MSFCCRLLLRQNLIIGLPNFHLRASAILNIISLSLWRLTNFYSITWLFRKFLTFDNPYYAFISGTKATSVLQCCAHNTVVTPITTKLFSVPLIDIFNNSSVKALDASKRLDNLEIEVQRMKEGVGTVFISHPDWPIQWIWCQKSRCNREILLSGNHPANLLIWSANCDVTTSAKCATT